MNKVIFGRIDWYKKYDLTEKPVQKDKTTLWNEQLERGIFYNNDDGFCYGYIQAGRGENGFSKDRIKFDSEGKAEGYDVVFYSNHNNKNLIVGFYENATLFKKRGITPNIGTEYNIKVECTNAHLIPEHLRNIEMIKKNRLNPIKGLYGQSNVWYADKESISDWINKTMSLLKSNKDKYSFQTNLEYDNRIDEEINDSMDNIIINGDINSEENQNIDQRLVKQYKRSAIETLKAIRNANYKCEYDNSHITFKTKARPNFTEGHHLVQICQDISRDHEYNIVSLCPNCHKRIHLGIDNEEIITKLYNDRKEKLKSIGIDITLDELLELYSRK